MTKLENNALHKKC